MTILYHTYTTCSFTKAKKLLVILMAILEINYWDYILRIYRKEMF